MNPFSFSPTRIALAVGAVLMAAAGSAVAVPMLTAASSASANNVPGIESTSSSAGYVGSSTSASATAGNGSGYAFSRSNGAYAVSSSGQGIGTGSAATSFATSITNSSGSALNYSMSFHIYGGSISTYLNNSASLTGTESLLATYMAEIKVGGTSVFSSGATVKRDASGIITETKVGTVDLNPSDTTADGYFSWSGGWYTVDLGTVASGASIDVLASLTDATQSNVGSYTFDAGCCDGYYGCPVLARSSDSLRSVAFAIGCQFTGFKGGASAFYGDPINFSSSPTVGPPAGGTQFGVTTSSVPEPGAYGLVALALGAAGLASRRRRQA